MEDCYRFCIIKCVFEGASKAQFVPMLMFAFSILVVKDYTLQRMEFFLLGLTYWFSKAISCQDYQLCRFAC